MIPVNLHFPRYTLSPARSIRNIQGVSAVRVQTSLVDAFYHENKIVFVGIYAMRYSVFKNILPRNNLES